jgi:hypothetical protein
MNLRNPNGLGVFNEPAEETSEVAEMSDHINECKFTSNMKTGVMLPGQSISVPIPANMSWCYLIFDDGEVLVDLSNPITQIPSDFANSTTRLMETNTACKFALTAGMSNVHLYNISRSVVISLVFE